VLLNFPSRRADHGNVIPVWFSLYQSGTVFASSTFSDISHLCHFPSKTYQLEIDSVNVIYVFTYNVCLALRPGGRAGLELNEKEKDFNMKRKGIKILDILFLLLKYTVLPLDGSRCYWNSVVDVVVMRIVR
jgi:hypothetical protein